MAAERPIFDPNRITPPQQELPTTRTLSVTQLNSLIKRILNDHLPTTIHLVGQISNLTHPISGHLYLTLKDEHSEIRAVMWRSAASTLKFKPVDGMEVIATGQVDHYEPRGQCQFYIRKLEPRGTGALELAFRQMRDRLSDEGLFDPKHKKTIPRFPHQIAVVTSSTGAAIRDILKTIRKRYPCASVLLHPARVQGEGAALEIAEAVKRLNRLADSLGGIEVMIVGRGGGSIEDLWPFNEEIVAQAIYNSKIPIISAVGHEIDVTIADLVADVRAPTPTAAGEIVVPVLDEVLEFLANTASQLQRAVRHGLDLAASRLQAVRQIEWFRDPIIVINRKEQQLDELNSRFQLCWARRLSQAHQRLHQIEMVLAKIQPATFIRYQQSRLNNITRHLRWRIQQYIRNTEHKIDRTRNNLLAASPKHRLELDREKITKYIGNLNRIITHRTKLTQHTLESLTARIEATSYRQTLTRGYTITRLSRGRSVITRPDQVQPGWKIVTETMNGEFESRIIDSDQKELFE
ncbi:MAG: exodeoxyribonuclease VII large subunit [Planctomycetota bacterium]|nr:MAG: exodeoxyribonuclease VII large subunit [Planctomycetota bacterium]